MNNDNIWIASFDIGIKNFAFYIEEFDQKKLESITPCTKNNRFHIKKGITEEYEDILKQVYNNGKTILHKNLDISVAEIKKQYLDPKVFLNLTKILDEHSEFFDKCSLFLIEQQMSFGRGKFAKINTKAIKIGQHTFSYFTIRYMGLKPVIEFEAYHKTQVFGMKKVKAKEHKTWSIDMCSNILSERGEDDILINMLKQKKKDDLSDVVIQLQAFKYLCYVEKKY